MERISMDEFSAMLERLGDHNPVAPTEAQAQLEMRGMMKRITAQKAAQIQKIVDVLVRLAK